MQYSYLQIVLVAKLRLKLKNYFFDFVKELALWRIRYASNSSVSNAHNIVLKN